MAEKTKTTQGILSCCAPESSCCGDAEKMPKSEDEIRKIVRDMYATVAVKSSPCCATESPCCDGTSTAEEISKKLGYSEEDMESAPEGANLGLGCGNPVALASLKEGETVLDLGSGAGFDCFLAANRVGKDGNVIGVDMTPEMLAKARENARKTGYENVEFRLGEIGHLPVADNSVDAIISNCVINLAPDKNQVFREAFRVLKPGGRLMVSDMVLLRELPESIRNSVAAYAGCISGAVMKDEYLAGIEAAGFKEVSLMGDTALKLNSIVADPVAEVVVEQLKVSPEDVKNAADSIVSIQVAGIKPMD